MSSTLRRCLAVVAFVVMVGGLVPTRASTAPRTQPSACATPTRTITGGGSAQISVAAGETVLLTDGTFTGGTNDFAAGSVLCVGTTAVFDPPWFNNPRGSLVVLGSSTMSSVSSTDTFSLRVEGTFVTGDLNLNGPAVVVVGATGTLTASRLSTSTGSVLTNHGTATLGGVNLNGDARIENSGSLTISSAVNANGAILNTGLLSLAGSLVMNSGATIENHCVVNVTGGLTLNSIGNRSAGIIRLTGTLAVSGSFVQTIKATLVAGGLSNDGDVAGFGRYRFSGDTRTQRAFAGSSAADQIVVQDVTPPPPPQIFDTQSGIVLNVVAGTVTDPPADARPAGCATAGASNADVAISVSGPAQATPGDAVAYRVTVRNDGPSVAVASTATLGFSPAVGVVDADGASVSGANLDWVLGDMSVGAIVVFDVVVTAPSTGTLTARVRAGSSTTDPLPGNNDGSADDHVVTTSIVPVMPPNRPPEVTDTLVVASFGLPVSGAVTFADPDLGQSHTVAVATPPSNGDVSMNPSGAFSYASVGDFTGLDEFTATVCDNGAPVLCTNGLVQVLIVPLATNDSAKTPVDTPVMIAVRDNDLGALAPGIARVSEPAHGTVVVIGDQIRYTPDPSFVGTDTFEYEVCSPDTLACAAADVNVVVESPPPNIPPVAEAAPIETVSGVPVAGLVTASDPDVGQTLTFALATPPASGAVVIVEASTGKLVYTPAGPFAGVETFAVVVCDDGSPQECDTAEVEVTVRPHVRSDSASTTLDVPVSIPVLANDLGAAPPPAVVGSVGDGTATVQPDDTILFVPATGFVGTTSFMYQACAGGSPTLCGAALVVVTVGPQPNRPPVVAPVAISILADTSGSTVVDASDPDAGQVLTLTISASPSSGTATLDGDVVTYVPAAGFTGFDSFEIEACDDASPSLCTTATASVEVSPFAQPASARTEVGEPVAIDLVPVVAGDDVALSIDAPPSDGSADPAGGLNVVYQPDSGFAGRDRFTYGVCSVAAPSLCSSAPTDVSVYPVASDVVVRTIVGQSVDIDVLSNDQVGDDMVPEIVEGPSHGVAMVLPNRLVRYTSTGTFTGVDHLTYRICTSDPDPECASAGVTIEVAPDLRPDTAATTQGVAVSIDVAVNDVGDAGAPVVILGPNSGSIDGNTLAALTAHFTRRLTEPALYAPLVYRPLPGFVGTDTFVYMRCALTAPHVCRTAVVTVVVTEAIPPIPTTTTTTTTTTTLPTGATTTTIAAGPVPPTTADPGSGTLPSTGSDASTPLLVAWALVAIGAIGLTARRRRSS